MIGSFIGGLEPGRRVQSLVLLTLVTAVCGCGSSQQQPKVSGVKRPPVVLKPEQRYRYVGEGKDKRKVSISRRERIRLQHEARKALDSQ